MNVEQSMCAASAPATRWEFLMRKRNDGLTEGIRQV